MAGAGGRTETENIKQSLCPPITLNSISVRMSQYCPGLYPFIPISDEFEILVAQFLIFAVTNYAPNPGRAHPDYILYFAFGMGGKKTK